MVMAKEKEIKRDIKDETKLKKKKKKNKLWILLLLVILIVGGLLFYNFKLKKNNNTPKNVVTVKVVDSLDDYGYSISDKDSKYYKSEFENLKKILKESKVDEEAYSTQVAKLFVIDLYTMSTKLNKYDVGGTEYFYKDKAEMYSKKVMDTLYSTLIDDTYGDRKQTLPEVSSVEVVSTEKTTYLVDEEKKDGYLVKLKISYVSDMGYDDEASVVVVKEDGARWSVVDYQPTLKPTYDED